MSAPELRVVEGQRSPAQRMHELFGAERAYLLWGDKSAKNYRDAAAATAELWQTHLTGGDGMVPMPMRSDATCLFGAIDVDVDVSHVDLHDKVQRLGLPLIVCRSSNRNRAHLYLFLSDPAPAAEVRSALGRMARALGYKIEPEGREAEVFPKETVPKDSGNNSGINAPYHGSEGGEDRQRYAIKPTGLEMSVAEFLATAEAARISPGELAQLAPETASRPSASRSASPADAEARLNHWAGRMIASRPGDHRNDLLAAAVFDLGRWCRDTDMEEDRAKEAMLRAWRSTKGCGKDTEAVFEDVWARQFAKGDHIGSPALIAEPGALPVFERLQRVIDDGSVTHWLVQIEGRTIEVTTPVLNDIRKFNIACSDHLLIFDIPKDRNAWIRHVRDAMAHAEDHHVEDSLSEATVFHELLEQFLTDKHRASSREEVFIGKPYEDEEMMRYEFRLKDLERYLAASGRLASERRKSLGERLRKMGGGDLRTSIKGKSVHLWWVPTGTFSAPPKVDLPPIEESPL